MSYFCTFVIPTIGRDTLRRTLQSVIDQTDPDWNAIVVADGLTADWTPPWMHTRILHAHTLKRLGVNNHGGMARNHALSNYVGAWVAFVDDDDRVDPNYVRWLKEDSKDRDVVVFHMRLPDGGVLPAGDALGCGGVGISFAVRGEFQKQNNLWFVPSSIEDWTFLEHCMNFGARIKVSDKIAYYVRH